MHSFSIPFGMTNTLSVRRGPSHFRLPRSATFPDVTGWIVEMAVLLPQWRPARKVCLGAMSQKSKARAHCDQDRLKHEVRPGGDWYRMVRGADSQSFLEVRFQAFSDAILRRLSRRVLFDRYRVDSGS